MVRIAAASRPLGALAIVLATACGSETAGQHGAPTAGSGGVAGSTRAVGGSAGAGTITAGGGVGAAAGSGGALAGLGGASGRAPLGDGAGAPAGGATAGAGAGGVRAAGSGGAPVAGSGGTDGFAIEVALASDLKSTAPTTVAIVRWSLDKPGITAAHIDFGLDTTYGMSAPVDLAELDYRTVLFGMKPEKTYHFRIVATDGSESYSSTDQTVLTGAATTLVPAAGVSVLSPKADHGFLITSSWMGDASWTAYIIDADGDIVWWYTDSANSGSRSDGLGRARLSANSHDVWMVTGQVSNPLRRVSIDTLDTETYADTGANHDIAAVSGDTMAYLDTHAQTCAIITEIDKTGTTKPLLDTTSLISTYCHANSIRYSHKQDLYLYSDRKTDVFAVDRAGNLKWKLSDKVTGGNATWGGMQHGVQLLQTSVLLFANEVDGDFSHSHAMEFGLDGSLIKDFKSAGGTDWFGDVQRLEDGNTLINYDYVIDEVDPDDNLLLSVQPNNALAYAEFRQDLYAPPLDIEQ